MPPQVIMQVLQISEDDMKAAAAEQKPPTCTLDQFVNAVVQSSAWDTGTGFSVVQAMAGGGWQVSDRGFENEGRGQPAGERLGF
mmetsp:Transcript_23260/g.36375  ORF Transcript_23260/g.36375 Transcript_23260/m.36375 type:complete len:84 (+) Transcript_23260:432-683(+)